MVRPGTFFLAAAIAASLAAWVPAARAFEVATMGDLAPAGGAAEFEVFLPPAPNPDLDALVVAQVTPGSPQYHHWLTPDAYRARFGTDPAVMAAAAAELEAAGLHVVARHAHGLRVRGTVDAVQRAFHLNLRVARFRDGHTTLAADRALTLTPVLAAHHAVIAAFSPLIRAHVHSIADLGPPAGITPDNRTTGTGPYWFDDLKQAYELPSYQTLDGTGRTIGIFVSNAYNLPDIQAYFAHEQLPAPSLSEVDIDGGGPFTTDLSKEVHLDIEQSGGIAPKASIIHYNIPDLSDAHIQDGLTYIVESGQPDIVSMSFGGSELGYAPSYNGGQDYTDILRSEDILFRQGTSEGITFVASTGDLGAHSIPALPCLFAGAKPGCGAFQLSAEFPASSPHVAAVGGTNLVTTYDVHNPQDLNSAYILENAYFDRLQVDPFYGTPAANPKWGSGGGVSIVFRQPSWQASADTGYAYRTVPDVAGHMGGCVNGSVYPCHPNRSSDVVLISGVTYFLHGTSASAPDFAGLVALRAQHEGGRLGLIAPLLYRMSAAQLAGTGPTVFREHIPGDNDYYKTKPGYNLVLGLGTLHGAAFCGFPQGPFAGVPQTPSNP